MQIADFGMSRELANTSCYVSTGGKVPVKWLAPEVGNSVYFVPMIQMP